MTSKRWIIAMGTGSADLSFSGAVALETPSLILPRICVGLLVRQGSKSVIIFSSYDETEGAGRGVQNHRMD
jgi:hypothetical protein